MSANAADTAGGFADRGFSGKMAITPRGKGVCCFIMLNPSTADATTDDPTIRQCIRFAQDWGYDSLIVRNLFPWRATEPRELVRAEAVYDMETVCGAQRGDHELLAAETADLVVVAWGASVPFGRDHQALAMLVKKFPNKPIYCLDKTKSGNPRHPLYVKANTKPVLFQ